MAWGSVDARMVTMASLWAAQLATRGSAFKHRAAGAMRGKGVDASVACDCAVSDVNDATDEASAAGSTTPPPPAPPNDARRCVSTRGAPGLSCSGTGDSARMRALDGHDDVIPGRIAASTCFIGTHMKLPIARFPKARAETEFKI